VISNTVGEPGEYLRPVLSGFGIDRYVESFVFSDEQPWTKPAPEIFRAALATIGTSPQDAVHVGDGWADIEGAHRAGYRGTILFQGLHDYGARYLNLFLSDLPDHAPPTQACDRLSEVAPIVREILKSP